MKTPPSGRVEAVVIEGSRPAVCNDCGQTLLQGRLEVVFPPQCKGIKLWFTPTHQRDGAACPAKSVDPIAPKGGAP